MPVHLDLQSLSDDSLHRLDAAVNGVLYPLVKIEPRGVLTRLEQRLSRFLSVAWRSAASSALVGVEGAARSAPALKRFLASVGLRLRRPLGTRQIRLLANQLDQIYKTVKRWQSRNVGTRFLFAQKDTAAIAATGRQQVFWVGDFYNTHLARRITGVAGEVLDMGLGRQQAGTMMRRALLREFGLKAGGKTNLAAHIPARFAGNPDHYFRLLAASAKAQAQSIATISSFEDARLTTYTLINPMDSRTGQVCQQMHGQRFTVAAARKFTDKVVAQTDPEGIKTVWPWMRPDDLETVIGGAKAGSTAAADRLAAAGQMLPPFHAFCRTEVVPD